MEKLLACYCKQMTILLEVYILVLLVVYICSTVCCKLHIYIFLIKTFHQGRMQSILAKLHSKSSLKEEESYKLRPAIMISQPLDVCCCKDVEDEQHFLLTWPAYSDITVQHRCETKAYANLACMQSCMPIFFSRPFLSQTCSLTLNQMHVVIFSKSGYLNNPLYPPDISLSAFYMLYSVCWSPGH